jgi:hypothetical protein
MGAILGVALKLLASDAVKTLIVDAAKLLAKRTDNKVDDDVVAVIEDVLSKV